MFHFNLLHSSLSIIFLFFACVYAAEPWPGPGDGPQNLKAFPSKVDCRLEVVFERDDKNYAYSVYGLYDNSNGPIKLQPFEVQDGSTWPVTVINGDSNDDVGAYQELASNERYTPLIVNECAEDVDHGNFQNQIFIRANPGGTGGVDVWESDHVIVKDEFIPSPGVTLNSVSAEKNLVLEANPGDDLSYTVNLEWSVEKFHAKEVLGFWTLASYRGSGTHFTNSLYWPLKDQYGGPNNGSGYVNFKVPANFDFDNDQHFFAAISVQTTEGAFSDPVTCPQQSFTIPKENPQ